MIETSQGKMGSYLVESHLAVKWPFLSGVNTFSKIMIKFEGGVREGRASVITMRYLNHNLDQITVGLVLARGAQANFCDLITPSLKNCTSLEFQLKIETILTF